MIRVMLFDWGDTVMRNLPYVAPMAAWPEVEAVPGIGQALADLSPHYRLALATNAADSGPSQIRDALQRVGLGDRFEAVLTARRLGARKPEPAFYRAVVQELGCAPGDVAMVGDDYPADVRGAKDVGLRAIWYNPSGQACPEAHPRQDAEVRHMRELAAVVGNLNLPDMGECLELLAGQEVPPAVQRHAEAVAMTAYRLAVRLQLRGEEVDPLLTHRGGLLHDLDKITSRRKNQTHGRLGAQLLREKGYPSLGDIVERHLMFTIMDPTDRPATWEQKLVYYVDKIVEGERAVGVIARVQALCDRYPENAARMRSCLPLVLELEAEICARLDSTPSDLLGSDQAGEACRTGALTPRGFLEDRECRH